MLDDVRFAFQPLFNLHTGGVVAVEALARPHDGSVQDLLQAAFRAGYLTNTDVALACRAVRHAADHGLGVPLHVNLLAMTIADRPELVAPLYAVLRETGRDPSDLVVEVGTPYSRAPRRLLVKGLRRLREDGFRLGLDGVGEGDSPLSLLTEVRPDVVKLDREVVVALPADPARFALVQALQHLCEHTGSLVVAEGVETEAQLAALRRLGVRLAQGNLLAAAQRRPRVDATIAAVLSEVSDPEATTKTMTGPVRRGSGPRVTDFLHPATTLPDSATSEEVLEVLGSRPTVTGVVLVDAEDRPSWTVDRNRFLLAVTGPFGHALHAKREAARLADRPKLIGAESSALELLDVVAHAHRERTNDDLVVVDAEDRCLGVVRVADVVRGIAELKVEQAAALNPLTRLPGTDSFAREVDRRVLGGELFAVGWLDVDGFKRVNDSVGFAAGDDLIRAIGRALTEGAGAYPGVHVGHVGGDDFLVVAGLDEIVPFSAAVLDAPLDAEGRAVTLSLATLICAAGSVVSYREVSRLLAPLKEHAKSLRGTSWVLGRPGSDHVDVLRGGPHLAVG
ncbi:EAL domain-containing protein (putative c-di-GMP-specific phosphodiesterase class I)/GGDEF domain-containing protein [Saccharothrix longispora]|uniref:EAL domain-containing protein (Putative c-di-GMP-specific phosphodiesterase class I)/GGDEF domain-containing protein n=1 Tax=Saccharothrix longispora TaxID=33920 RepID=A0ABU1PYL9_9PSEU|nr:EAL domain-containing protein (putative c-di-GMP-specific phosphodiesterase class I)/GGDEF domain-containing protein [Saccharothrix longispora]